MTTLNERMTAFERLSLASKLDLLAREVFSQKYGYHFNHEVTLAELNANYGVGVLEFQIGDRKPIRRYPHKWDFPNIENFGGFPASVVDPPVKLEKSKWIPNFGGECPVEKGTLIEVEYRDGIKQVCKAMDSDNVFGERCATQWKLWGHPWDIVGYRLVPEEELHLYRKPEEEPVTMTVKESNESLKLKQDEKESAKDKEIKQLREAVMDLLSVLQFMQEGGQGNSLQRVMELAKTAVNQHKGGSKMRYKIKPCYQWRYLPGQRVGVFHLFGWCLIVSHFRYFLDGKEVQFGAIK